MAVATDLSTVLKAVRQKLVDDGVFTNSQAFLSLDPDDIMVSSPASPVAGVTFQAFDQRPDTLNSEQDTDDTPTMEGEVIVGMWIRVNLDAPGRDLYLMSKETIGATQLIKRIIGSLQQADLVNEDGDFILWRTLTFTGVRQRGRWSKDRAWRRFDVRFNCTFSWGPLQTLDALIYSDDPEDTILAEDTVEILA